jgi:hypothetical protein
MNWEEDEEEEEEEEEKEEEERDEMDVQRSTVHHRLFVSCIGRMCSVEHRC